MDIVGSVHQQKDAMQLQCLPYTLEITGKAIEDIVAAQHVIPQGTAINIAFLGNENHAQRIHAAKTIRDCGFEPVPIISSRRLLSVEDRDQLLSSLIKEAAPKRFLLVGGDPAQPAGPFQDSLSLLNSKIVESFGIRHVAITGYPEGHPKIDQQELWRCLKWKLDYVRQAECSVEITTQFGFDAQAVVRWIERLRSEGIDTPVRVGIPGPADAAKLLRFAKQFGVVASASIMRRYGLSLANLMRRSVADRYWEDLNALLLKQDLGQVYFHLYPFGGVAESVTWMNEQLQQRSS